MTAAKVHKFNCHNAGLRDAALQRKAVLKVAYRLCNRGIQLARNCKEVFTQAGEQGSAVRAERNLVRKRDSRDTKGNGSQKGAAPQTLSGGL